MLTTSLSQEIGLNQKLSPAQIQIVKMLEVPACEMMQRVNEELQENPALEEGHGNQDTPDITNDGGNGGGEDEEFVNELQNEDFNYDNYIEDDETPDYRTRANNYSDDDKTVDIPFTAGISFMEFLKRQVYLTKMNKAQRHIAKFVLGFIDDDGYLRCSIEELVDNLAFQESLIVTEQEMTDIVHEIQQFEPSGVGAKDLKECLMIQLSQKPQTDSVHLAQRVIQRCFKEFSHHRYQKVTEILGVSNEALQGAVDEIIRLNPKPGSAWVGTIYERHQTSVIPDFIIENVDGVLHMQLNDDDIPELHVSRDYRDMIQDLSSGAKPTAEQKKALQFAKAKVDAAVWFIDAIRQRNQTLTRTMQAIMHRQQAYLMEGDKSLLKPMILQDIADDTQYDVSTISRITNNKYVQTEFGIFPLRSFFSEGMINMDGEEISTHEIKQALSEMIDSEDKAQPYTDIELSKLLLDKGYRVARRTVAKYRDQLGQPIAQLRKQMKHHDNTNI
ncbi:MAG: RNA polymerase factor sigma-54 [Bacteroidales bacterium]|nr:RNA polymerase factor sigma-54 [Candidatus Colicola coprequi]